MADLLRSGQTMLNLACPICNNPIFKNKNGEKYCPVCNKKVVIIENEVTSKTKEYIKESTTKNSNLTIWSTVKGEILKKVEWLIENLRDETQVEKIENYINLLSKCFNLYRQIA